MHTLDGKGIKRTERWAVAVLSFKKFHQMPSIVPPNIATRRKINPIYIYKISNLSKQIYRSKIIYTNTITITIVTTINVVFDVFCVIFKVILHKYLHINYIFNYTILYGFFFSFK